MTVMAERTSSQMSVDVFDRIAVLVHSNPNLEDGYRDIHVVRLGGKVTLPDPVGIELDTEELKQYVD
ncbi:hypothetical protein ACWDFR_07825 [Streptomyces sp. 900105755]